MSNAGWWAKALGKPAQQQQQQQQPVQYQLTDVRQVPQQYQVPQAPQQPQQPQWGQQSQQGYYAPQAPPQQPYGMAKPQAGQVKTAMDALGLSQVTQLINVFGADGNVKEGIPKYGGVGTCPDCGSGNYFARAHVGYTSESGQTPIGTPPAPQCFDCGYNSRRPQQGQAESRIVNN